jgi:ethanolamine transporter EutH
MWTKSSTWPLARHRFCPRAKVRDVLAAMDALAIMQVSGPVVAAMCLLRWSGVPHRWAPVLVPVVSALGVGVWVFAHGLLSRADMFSYVAAWIAVSTSAATVWGFSWMTSGQPGKS